MTIRKNKHMNSKIISYIRPHIKSRIKHSRNLTTTLMPGQKKGFKCPFILSTTIGLTIVTGLCGSKLYLESQKPKSEKINIVFDLDETLVVTKYKKKHERTNSINKPKPLLSSNNYYIWIRPYVHTTLYVLSQFANLHLFTRGTQDYADDVCKLTGIDHYFDSKLYREHCEKHGKDLLKISHNLTKSVLVDNLLTNKLDGQNFYHIPDYEASNKLDTEMLKLMWHFINYILFFNTSVAVQLSVPKN